MERNEEVNARVLYGILTQRLSRLKIPIKVTIGGAGCQWHCLASLNGRSCRSHCFEGPQYLTYFSHDGNQNAYGRTGSAIDTAGAVSEWLHGSDLSSLYEKYTFVDEEPRLLAQIQDDIGRLYPDLSKTAQSATGECGRLKFQSGDRSSLIHIWNKAHPAACFFWDGCELFQYKTEDKAALANVLHRWVLDGAMPSTMRRESPWLEIPKLADYFENGNPIEGEFLNSWDGIENFYGKSSFAAKGQALDFVAQIRQAGYDRALRAGRSLKSLIVSRSRRHGLSPGQPCIQFWFDQDGVSVHPDGAETADFHAETNKLAPEVDALLKELMEKEVTEPLDW